MAQIQLDEISVEELYALQKEIYSYISTQDAAEGAYCQGCPEYKEIHQSCQDKAQKLKQRVRSLAIAWGVQGEFLDEYVASCKRDGLKLVAG